MYGENFTDSETGWTKYMDIDSIVDWYIVNEFAKNNDAIFFSSVYMYYDPSDSKLHLGPNWDFDLAYGNVNDNGCDNSEVFWIKNAVWISRMFEDPQFVTKLKARWNEKKSELQETFSTNGTIQTLADSISVSAEYNFKKWLSNRYNWLDSAINDL